MRILFVVHTFPPDSWGGTELHLEKVAHVLRKRHDVRIFTAVTDPSRPHGEVTRGWRDGLEVTRFNNLHADSTSFESFYRNRRAHRAFVSELEAFEPDLVHLHHLTALSTTMIEACKRRGLPTVFTLHDFWTVCPRGQRLTPDLRICEEIDRNKCYSCLHGLWPDWFDDRLGEPTVVGRDGQLAPRVLADFDHHMHYVLDLCDVLLTPSEFHRERMLEFDLDPDRIIALPHGLDHSQFRPARDPGRPVRVIAYIGSVIPTKGVHVLVEAFKHVRAPGLELRIYGQAPQYHEKTGYLQELQSLALGTGQTVRFMGGYEYRDVGAILEHVDTVVVPSLWWETFSLTIREALLAGVPVIASGIGAMREALADSGAGLLFEVGDAHDLARKLQQLIDEKELRLRLAERRPTVKTIEQNAKDYLKVYKKAQRIAERREDSLLVAPSSFPEEGSEAETSGSSPAGAGEGNVRFSVEKVGGGDVKVASSVEKGESTRVSFTFDYDDGSPPGEMRVVINFGAEGAAAPAPAAAAAADEARPSSAASLMQAQTEDFDSAEREKAMYMLDKKVFAEQVKAVDDMVGETHLDEEEQEIPTSREPRERSVRERTERSRTDEGRRERKPRSEARRERQDRRERRDRDEGEKRESKPRREPRDRSAREESSETGRRARKPEAPPPERAKPAPKATPVEEKPAADPTPDGAFVWGDDVSAGWSIPEPPATETVEPKEKEANFRVGRQPGMTSAKEDAGFGEGLDGSE